MDKAPDRIWTRGNKVEGSWVYTSAATKKHDRYSTEYIRADLVPQWQPIETAPKDGAEVLAFRCDAGVFIAWFGTMEHLSLTDSEIETWNEETFFSGDWWTNSQDGAFRLENEFAPTHWMPLPTTPPEKSK